MKPKKITILLPLIFISFCLFSQTGTSTNPFTSLSQAASVTTAGNYYFSIGGNSFSSDVDANGFVLVAIDFGNGSGDLPTTSSLSASNRGILTPIILKKLDFFNQTKITGPTIDYISNHQMIANRIRNNRPLCHGGTDQNYSSSSFTNNGGSGTTQFTSYGGSISDADDSTKLSQKVYHCLGNVNGIHWMPNSGAQQEAYVVGEISNTSSLKLWIKAACSQPTVPGFGNNTWNVSVYSFNEYNNLTDFNSLASPSIFSSDCFYGFYSNSGSSISSSVQWGQSSSPSSASGWSGCSLANDYFITRFQRKGFTPGFYKISLPQNDDGVKIFLNGVEIYSFNGCCINKGVIFEGALCASSELEVRMIEYIGGSSLVLNVESIPWPVNAGVDGDVIGGETNSIGLIVNSSNTSLLTSNTWTSSPASSVASTVPASVSPNETTTYTLTSIANGCSYTDVVTLFVIGLLPVELISFNVNCRDENNNEISWSTASEHNAAFFIVEKSSDGSEWKEINKIEAAGNSSSRIDYSITDYSMSENTVYYRLKQVDRDGVYKMYDAKSIYCLEEDEIRIYPNPTSDGKFTLSKDVEYTIFDSVGNKINSIEMSGVYLLLIEGKLYKLIKL